jgi:gamma-glutamylcyclotransferase (GGCT)/AIG2-like uncharacterized protein YtfP
MAERLFVYGTLHPDRAPREIADLVRRFEHIGEGTVRGRLYDLGSFPAIILDRKSGPIRGEVFAVPREPNALARLDAYEEYSPEAPDDSLFLRRKTKVTLDDGSAAQCWVYVYNKPLPADRLSHQLASVA